MHPRCPGNGREWTLPLEKSLRTGCTEFNDGRLDPARRTGPEYGPWVAKKPGGSAAGTIKPPFRPGG